MIDAVGCWLLTVGCWVLDIAVAMGHGESDKRETYKGVSQRDEQMFDGIVNGYRTA